METEFNLTGSIIRLIHIVLIMFILLGIFFEKKELVRIHAAILLSIMVHWILNNNSCFLTVLEKKIYGIENNEETFIYQIVSPIYTVNDDEISKLVYLFTFFIYSYSVYKLN